VDVQSFFDSVPWDLMVRAVEAVTDARWVLLYVKRWLAVPLQYSDGTLVERDKGTPQGSAVSPILANLFMHFAFDMWMAREFPSVAFERYADDVVVHCVSRWQAEHVLARIAGRMREVGLRLHPEKTHVVYCKDGKRQGSHEHTTFTFLGFMFRARKARATGGGYFTSFQPALSTEALKAKSADLRAMRIHRRTNLSLGSGPMAESYRGWVDELLRPVLPVGYVSPSAACQHLPETLGWEEVSGAADLEEVPTVVGWVARSSAWHVFPLEVGPFVLTGW
jgi:hypothetical protein